MASGSYYAFLQKSIQEFNDTNEYGITVEEMAEIIFALQPVQSDICFRICKNMLYLA